MRPTVKVMADHGAYPLWRDGGMVRVNRAAGAPPVSQGLSDRLRAWAIVYDRHALTVRWEDMVGGWNRDGRALAAELAQELGTNWRVVYFDEISGDEHEMS